MNDAVQEPPRLGKTCGLAIWSLVLGICGLILCCVGVFPAIAAVICGHVALPRITRAAGALAGRGIATAGLVIGYVAIFLQLLIVPIVLGMALPAVAAAREKARRSACMSHLVQINFAIRMYSTDNKGSYPVDLQGLVSAKYMRDDAKSADIFLCPSSGHRPGPMAGVSTWTDYAYVTGRQESDSPDTVIAFCKPGCHNGPAGNVLFLDGHVKWCDEAEYARLTSGLTR